VGSGKEFPPDKFFPVVENNAAEANRGKQRLQSLGYVPASKDKNLARKVDGFPINAPVSGLDQNAAVPGQGFYNVSAQAHPFKGKALCIQGHGPIAGICQVDKEPEVFVFFQTGKAGRYQSYRFAVAPWDKLKIDIHIAAAYHAQFFLIILVEPVSFAPGLAPFQQGLGKFHRFVLHRSAANGSADPALLVHQHVSARAPGAGPGFGHDGCQYRVLTRTCFLKDCLKQVFNMHRFSPYWESTLEIYRFARL
jgi:hypothetical protein